MALNEKTWRILLTTFLVFGTLMQTLDTTIANVALPHMQGSLNATQDQIAWVATSYIVASAISMSLTGFLAERFGRKRMLIAATVGFTLTSLLCAVATNIGQIVAFRALQGFCSAWMLPLTQAVLMEAYPREKQAQAISWWGMGSTLGPMMGPTIGGYITEHFTWRWVFLINLPLGIITVAGLIWLVRESDRKPRNYFDMLGFGFLAVALASLQLMLDRGQTQGWFESGEIVMEAIVSAVCFYLFVVHVFTTMRPFINLRIFNDRNFVVGLLLVFFASAVPMATMVMMPLLMQNVMGYPVETVGVLMAPRGLGNLLSTWGAVYAMRYIGPRTTSIGGLVILTLTSWMMSNFTTDAPESLLMLSGLFQGLGTGFLYMPLNVVMLATIDRRFLTEISSFSNIVRSVGSSVGISVFMTIMTQNLQVVRAGLTEYINPFSAAVQQMVGQNAGLSTAQRALAMINVEIERQAAMTAYVNDFKLLMLVSIALVPLIFMFRRVDRPPPKEVQMMTEA